MAKCGMYTCDICGDHYEGGTYKYTYGAYSSSIYIYDYGTYSDKAEPKNDHYDLCPCCMTRVKNYINALIEQEKCKTACLCAMPTKKRSWFRRG